MIARAERNSAYTMSGKEMLFRLGSFGASNKRGISHIAGYKLLSYRDLSSIRANDVLALAVTRKKDTLRSLLLTQNTSPCLFVPVWTGRRDGASLISRLHVYWLQFKGWITPEAESERITIPSGKPSIRVRMNVVRIRLCYRRFRPCFW